MKIKTSELTGPALDWAVAKCEAWVIGTTDDDLVSFVLEPSAEEMHFWPSTDWSHGGPIIEREDISMVRQWATTGHQWWCHTKIKPHPAAFGQVQLIAAMRCYVASKLGDKVEVPDELINKE